LDKAVTILLNGVSYSFILFLLASGLSLIFGVMGILNLAHGAFYMIGAYVGLTVAGLWSNFAVGVVSSIVAVGIIGFLVDRIFFKRLYRKINEQALLTLGLVYIASNVVLWIWGPHSKMGKAPGFLSGSLTVEVFISRSIGWRSSWWGSSCSSSFGGCRTGRASARGSGRVWMTRRWSLAGRQLRTHLHGDIHRRHHDGRLCRLHRRTCDRGAAGDEHAILLLAMIVAVVGGLGSIQGALLGSLIIGSWTPSARATSPTLHVHSVCHLIAMC